MVFTTTAKWIHRCENREIRWHSMRNSARNLLGCISFVRVDGKSGVVGNFLGANRSKGVERQFRCGARISLAVRTGHRWGSTSQCVEQRQLRCYRILLRLTQGNILAFRILLGSFLFSFLLLSGRTPTTREPVRAGCSDSYRFWPRHLQSRWSLAFLFPSFLSNGSWTALHLPNGPLYHALMPDAPVSRLDPVSETSSRSATPVFRFWADEKWYVVPAVTSLNLSSCRDRKLGCNELGGVQCPRRDPTNLTSKTNRVNAFSAVAIPYRVHDFYSARLSTNRWLIFDYHVKRVRRAIK